MRRFARPNRGRDKKPSSPNFPPRPLGCRPGTLTWWTWRYYAGTPRMSADALRYLTARAEWLDALDAYAAAGDKVAYATILLAGRTAFGWKECSAQRVGRWGPYDRLHTPRCPPPDRLKPGRLTVAEAKAIYFEFCKRSFWGWVTGASAVVEKHLGRVPWERNLPIKTRDEHAEGEEEIIRSFPDLLYMQILSELADQHPRLAIVKSRKMIVTWWACARALHKAMFTPAREVICQCKKESESDERLLERIWFMYRHMPRWVTNEHPAIRTTNRIEFPYNGSKCIAVAQGPDPWRSPTASMGIIDEAAAMEYFDDTLRAAKPALSGTTKDMPLLVISTPNGKDGFYRLVMDIDPSDDGTGDYDPPVKGQIHGMRWWLNRNGFLSVDIGHEADPSKDPETPEGAKWWARIEREYRGDPLGLAREYKRSFETTAGKPVYGLVFNRETHVLPTLQYMKDAVVYRGWDFGYHRPAVCWCFENEYRQLCCLYELLGKDQDITPFVKRVLELSKQWFPDTRDWFDFADPQGWAKSDVSDKTRVQVLNQFGVKASKGEVYAVPRTDITRRALAVRDDGRPGLIFHPRCRTLVDAFAGAYRYPEPRPDLPEAVANTPLKDGYYDHLANAIEYLVTGLRMVTGKPKNVVRDRQRPPEDPYADANEVTGW